MGAKRLLSFRARAAENVVREDTHHQQTAAAAVHAEPVVQQREPVAEHRARPNHPEGALALDSAVW